MFIATIDWWNKDVYIGPQNVQNDHHLYKRKKAIQDHS